MRTAADLTATNVGAALTAAGVVGVDPVEVIVEPLVAGHGFLGTLVRVRLTWPDRVAGPLSIVAKLPTSEPANEWIVQHFGYDRREAGVYRDLRPWEHAPAPRCLAQFWDDDAGRGCLLLDDLGELDTGDQLDGATDRQAHMVVDALAAWHAAWWDDPRLAELDWLPDASSAEVAGYGEIFDATWETCVERLEGAIADDVWQSALSARSRFESALTEFRSGPRTLVHGDARLDNTRFATDHAVLLDFQLATHSRGAYDVAFFCAGSLSIEARRRLEPDLLDRYLTGLHRRGVEAYSRSQLEHDYRLGHIVNLPNPVSALAVVAPGSERGAEFLRRNAIRGITATADHLG